MIKRMSDAAFDIFSNFYGD